MQYAKCYLIPVNWFNFLRTYIYQVYAECLCQQMHVLYLVMLWSINVLTIRITEYVISLLPLCYTQVYPFLDRPMVPVGKKAKNEATALFLPERRLLRHSIPCCGLPLSI